MIIKLKDLPTGTQIRLNPRNGYRFIAKAKLKASLTDALTVLPSMDPWPEVVFVADKAGVVVPLHGGLKIHHMP